MSMEKKITGDEPIAATGKGQLEIKDGKTIYCYYGEDGLTIRQHFAAMAMQGILANNPTYLHGNVERPIPESVAAEAVIYADALLSSLNKVNK